MTVAVAVAIEEACVSKYFRQKLDFDKIKWYYVFN